VKPARGPAAEDCCRGQTAAGGGKLNLGVMGNGAQGVKAASESLPAGTEEVILG